MLFRSLPGGTGYIGSSANNITIYSDTAETNGMLFYDTGSEVYSVGDFKIFTDNANTSYHWNFDSNGKLTLPANGDFAHIQTGNNKALTIETPGDTLQRLQITPADGVKVYSNNDGSLWQFDNDGNLTIPKNILGPNNGNPIVVDAGATGDSYISIPSFTDGGEQLVIKNAYYGSQGIRIETETGNFVFGGSSLTFPDSTVQSTAYTGASSYGDSNVAKIGRAHV